MAFWKSEDDKKEEMEEVKRQVEGRDTRLPEPPKPSPPEASGEEKLPEAGEEVEEPSVRTEREEGLPEEEIREDLPDVTRKPPSQETGEDFAPLFVKIDKYKKVLQNLEQVRSSLDDLSQLFELMNQVDEVKRKGMKELRHGMSGLTDTLISMDEKFIRPEGAEEVITEPETGTSKTVRELQSDLRQLRDKLERIE
ncbi:MAG: hypothetical protein ACLFTQ_03735 [Candidatus Aenigmatarchaeota archaeon]